MSNVLNYLYVFECDYGSRMKEIQFIKDILNNFDKDYATMVAISVGNNPYCLHFNIQINLQDDPVKFEQWVKEFYPEKIKRHNISIGNSLAGNVMSFDDANSVDDAFSEYDNAIFIWPERETLVKEKPSLACLCKNQPDVFISHSSLDKELIVNPLQAYLQGEQIGTWLDSYEIDYGDNIYLKVNEGIEQAKVGLFILTDHFFDKRSGWPLTEFTTFFMEMMKSNKKVLLVNAGADQDKIHATMKSYKIIDWFGKESLPEIGKAIAKLL